MKKIATYTYPVANEKNIRKIDKTIGDNYDYDLDQLGVTLREMLTVDRERIENGTCAGEISLSDITAYLFTYCFWSDALQILRDHFSDFYADSLNGVIIKGC